MIVNFEYRGKLLSADTEGVIGEPGSLELEEVYDAVTHEPVDKVTDRMRELIFEEFDRVARQMREENELRDL